VSAVHLGGEAASVLCRDPALRRSVAAIKPYATPSRTVSSRAATADEPTIRWPRLSCRRHRSITATPFAVPYYPTSSGHIRHRKCCISGLSHRDRATHARIVRDERNTAMQGWTAGAARAARDACCTPAAFSGTHQQGREYTGMPAGTNGHGNSSSRCAISPRSAPRRCPRPASGTPGGTRSGRAARSDPAQDRRNS